MTAPSMPGAPGFTPAPPTDISGKVSSKGGQMVDYFIKFEGVAGESTDQTHKNEINVQSWSWGESQSGGFQGMGAGTGAGKVSMQDFSFSSFMSKATPMLMKFCATGKHIKSAILVARKAGDKQQDYFKITFTEVMITSHQISASSTVPIESTSFAFHKVEVEYKPQKADGSLDSPTKFSYDLQTNVSA